MGMVYGDNLIFPHVSYHWRTSGSVWLLLLPGGFQKLVAHILHAFLKR
jgi:hypothetical protein